MKYGRAVRIVRAVRAISQTELARRAGVDQTYVSLIEKETRTPTQPTLERIAKALAVPPVLLDLLASEKEDLEGIDPAEASALGLKLVELLARVEDGSAEERLDEKDEP